MVKRHHGRAILHCRLPFDQLVLADPWHHDIPDKPVQKSSAKEARGYRRCQAIPDVAVGGGFFASWRRNPRHNDQEKRDECKEERYR